MKTVHWFRLLSLRQQLTLLLTVAIGSAVILAGILLQPEPGEKHGPHFHAGMSIKEIAPRLGVTGKALARELKLPLDAPKNRPLRQMNITDEQLSGVTGHLRSHGDAGAKYFFFLALVPAAVVYLTRLGRPEKADSKQRKHWYPRLPYILALILSVAVAGFYYGKSPNPMEGAVKLFKSMVGLYPDPAAKVGAFLFFIVLAVIGNKVICGWACPFGALQELIYSLPLLREKKRRKPPFALTNTIRTGLFVLMLLLLFGIIGGHRGFVLYHYINPFNLFDLHFENIIILLTVIVVLAAAFYTYRPFCRFICPFGLISWLFERISLYRVRIDRDRCTRCGNCIRACPLNAAEGRVEGRRLPEDCFSCARCLNVCPVDAVRYGPSPKRSR